MMTEDELTAEVLELAARHGVLAHHCPDSRRCQGHKGFPDLIIAGPGGVIIAELKSEEGETDAPQDLWAWTLDVSSRIGRTHGGLRSHRYVLWRPSDLDDGTIENAIKGVSGQ